MNQRTRHAIGAGVTLLIVAAGLSLGGPSASSAVTTYTCTGATNDVAAREPLWF